MGEQRTIDSFRPVEREVRFALPFWSSVGVLVNGPDDIPDLEHRQVRKVVLDTERIELSSAHVATRIERFRANGVQYLLVPADVYPWLDRHEELRRFLRTQFRRVPVDEEVCRLYALQSRDGAEAETGDDGLPLPPPEMVALVAGWIKREEFFRYGRYAATWIAEMLTRNGIPPSGLGTLFDFGCGCGRVIRHWPALTGARLSGSDYNPHLVQWCAENLPFGEFRVNELEPPLPFEDDSFDLVYALSIFTHLDAELQIPWMEELTRVTRPGGVLLPTFHGRSRVEYMREHGMYEQIAPAFEAGELVVLEAERAGSNECSVYHPESYVRDVLGAGLELLDFSPAGALDIQQDAVLFRKPAAR
ncbi:MAG TPA: class I SAM-dependent methyltransferase [Solirubrobacterales bacterium]|nr:class I SAM-dependent methyltransferase [Solirubrobacterales bacterium]